MKTAEARDDLFDEAVRVVKESGRGSVSLLQRRLRIGYNRAGRIIDQLEEAGLLGPDQGGSMGRVVYLEDSEKSTNGGIQTAQGQGNPNERTTRIIGQEASGKDAKEGAAFDDDFDDDTDEPGSERTRVWM